MALDRYQMSRIKKRPNESFRDYAQQWRKMAAQVHPPVDENEMVMTFIETQEAPYYEKILAGIGKPFSKMIKYGDMVEIQMQSGKIKDFSALEAIAEHLQSGNYGNKRNNKKEEDLDHLISHILYINVISFTDDDIPAEGTGHRKPLHIAAISSDWC